MFYTQTPNNIYPIAVDLLSAPASEAFVERMFSLCGLLSAGRRNGMHRSMEIRAFLKLNPLVIEYWLTSNYACIAFAVSVHCLWNSKETYGQVRTEMSGIWLNWIWN